MTEAYLDALRAPRMTLGACASTEGGECAVAAYIRADEPSESARCHKHGGRTARDALRAELGRRLAITQSRPRPLADPEWERIRLEAALAVVDIEAPSADVVAAWEPNDEDDYGAGWRDALDEAVGRLARGWIRP